MTLLLDTTIKTTVVLLGALLAVRLLRRGSAALRHWLLASAVTCAACLPLLDAVVPHWPLPFGHAIASASSMRIRSKVAADGSDPPAVRRFDAATTAVRPASASRREPPGPSFVLVEVWLAGAAVNLLVLMAGHARLRRLAVRARRVDDGPWREALRRVAGARPVTLLATDESALLVTWGLRAPRILFPSSAQQWPAARVAVVVAHEMAHIRRGDWLVHIAGEVLRALHWFNPVVWLATSTLRRESELACDDLVLASGMEGSEYASHLVALAREVRSARRRLLVAPAIVGHSCFEERIHAMLNRRANRRPITPLARTAVAAALVAATIGVAFAQTAFATVFGSISDATGAFVPNATIVLTDTRTQAKHEVRSNESGQYEIVGVTAGDYELEARLTGFTSYRESFTLSARQTLAKNVTMKIGSLQETITIKAGNADGAPRSKTRPAPAAAKPCSASAVGGRIVPPLKITDVKPLYPAGPSASNAGGRVELTATIAESGHVKPDVQVISSPNPDMAEAAVEAVRQWEFSPTLLNCRPVEVEMAVTVNFAPQP